MNIKTILIRIHWFMSAQLGVDLIKTFNAIRGIIRYIRDLVHFKKGYTGALEVVPCLHDWHEEGGAVKNEYFWQDLLVARKIFSAQPVKHVDIGSRVDGFVAHVASFREIELFDIRPITTFIPGVIFTQADLMGTESIKRDYCDSISCLHALEHFGLGRYGDPIDPKGYVRGIENMSKILCFNGVLYISVPIGYERVEFNAQHVFNPQTIIDIAASNKLLLDDFVLFTHQDGIVIKESINETLLETTNIRYGLGIFTFKKTGQIQ